MSYHLEEAVRQAAPAVGGMALALERRRTTRASVREWIAGLRRAIQELEAMEKKL